MLWLAQRLLSPVLIVCWTQNRSSHRWREEIKSSFCVCRLTFLLSLQLTGRFSSAFSPYDCVRVRVFTKLLLGKVTKVPYYSTRYTCSRTCLFGVVVSPTCHASFRPIKTFPLSGSPTRGIVFGSNL